MNVEMRWAGWPGSSFAPRRSPLIRLSVPHPLLVFAIAFGATLVASMSGGSASTTTTPAWTSWAFRSPRPSAATVGRCPPRATTCASARRTGACSCPWHCRAWGRAWPWGWSACCVPAAMLLGLVAVARSPIGAVGSPGTAGADDGAAGAPAGVLRGAAGVGEQRDHLVRRCAARGLTLLRALAHCYVVAFAGARSRRPCTCTAAGSTRAWRSPAVQHGGQVLRLRGALRHGSSASSFGTAPSACALPWAE